MAPHHSINVELTFSRKPINEIDNPNNPSISIEFWSQAIAQYTHIYIYIVTATSLVHVETGSRQKRKGCFNYFSSQGLMLLDYQILESRLIHEWGTPTIYTCCRFFIKKKEAAGSGIL
jgi:hypothetical protein